MKAIGDIESVNLNIGECRQRVCGNGESTLETVRDAWHEWAEQRERETVWRRDRNGTPGNRAIDELCFSEGFKKGVEYALSKRP